MPSIRASLSAAVYPFRRRSHVQRKQVSLLKPSTIINHPTGQFSSIIFIQNSSKRTYTFLKSQRSTSGNSNNNVTSPFYTIFKLLNRKPARRWVNIETRRWPASQPIKPQQQQQQAGPADVCLVISPLPHKSCLRVRSHRRAAYLPKVRAHTCTSTKPS